MKDIQALTEKLAGVLPRIKRSAPLLFCLLLALLYGFLFYSIKTLNSSEPSSADVASKTTTAKVPHIDQSVIDQLKSLQDNSVSVQALFDQTRSNPFQ